MAGRYVASFRYWIFFIMLQQHLRILNGFLQVKLVKFLGIMVANPGLAPAYVAQLGFFDKRF